MRRLTGPLITAVLLLGLGATPALASGQEVIDDCAWNGVIDGRYSEDELRDAQQELPSDVDEYYDCRDLIRAELGKRDSDKGKQRGGAGADPSLVTESGATAGSPEDIAALDALTARDRAYRGDSPDVGGGDLSPGGRGRILGVAQSRNDVPASLISALGAVLLAALAGTAALVRRRGLQPALAGMFAKLGTLQRCASAAAQRLPRPFRRR